ncbi:MAG: hypothetical protein IJ848_02515 [Alphaproteobacteria bacterium]|nr:hypothetical protein [Alphaproteobacteria bacterium]
MKKQTTKILSKNTNQISDNSTDNNTSYLGAILEDDHQAINAQDINSNNISFGNDGNNFVVQNNENVNEQDNNAQDNINIVKSIEATQNNNINNNEKQYFNNNTFEGKVIINNKNASVNNSTL